MTRSGLVNLLIFISAVLAPPLLLGCGLGVSTLFGGPGGVELRVFDGLRTRYIAEDLKGLVDNQGTLGLVVGWPGRGAGPVVSPTPQVADAGPRYFEGMGGGPPFIKVYSNLSSWASPTNNGAAFSNSGAGLPLTSPSAVTLFLAVDVVALPTGSNGALLGLKDNGGGVCTGGSNSAIRLFASDKVDCASTDTGIKAMCFVVCGSVNLSTVNSVVPVPMPTFASGRRIHRAIWDGVNGSSSYIISGVGQQGSLNAPTTQITPALTQFAIGDWGGLEADLYEILIYDRVLNSDEINNVEGYLRTKYGTL